MTPALAVAAPLLAAAVLLAGAKVLPRFGIDLLSTAVAGAVAVGCAVLARQASDATIVAWLSGWERVGIPLVADPAGAGLAAFAALLVTAALVYSWRYLEEVEDFFHALLLLFLAAMVAFCLVGDLFTLFVAFELMTVCAVALTAFHTEDAGPLQGAFTFAVTNLLGSFLALTGVVLLYARGGTLNIAAVGAELAGRPADGLVVLAFVLLLVGFGVKAAVVPLHFWLADAHAVAPSPVCMLLSGIMVPLGLYGVARLYWAVFAAPLGGAAGPVLVGAGVLTALVGAAMCPVQGHIKRLLAYSTISHTGVFLVGLGVLSGDGLAGAGLGIVAHGLVKAGLFGAAGVMLNRYGTVDEGDLRGRGRDFAALGVIWAVGGLILASLPGSGLFLADARIEEAARASGYRWFPAVLVPVAALTGGAVLRVAATVFLGWGPPEQGVDPTQAAADEAEPETEGARLTTTPLMVVPSAVLVAAALGLWLAPGLDAAAHAAAERMQHGYVAAVLSQPSAPEATSAPEAVARSSLLLGALSSVGALAVAWGSLHWHAAPRALHRLVSRVAAPLAAVRRLHSGHAGDDAAWLVFATAVLGLLTALAVA